MTAGLLPANEKHRDRVICLMLLVLGTVMFCKDISIGGLRYSDACTHAMDGVLIHDWIALGPQAWFHPLDFAVDQYAHYPTLGIGRVYPPGFAVVESLFFGVLGVNAVAARLCTVAFALVAIVGCYKLARRFTSAMAAGCATGFLICLPAVVLWSRQVMLEMPTLAVLIWATYASLWYLEKPLRRRWAVAIALTLAAPLFKQTAVFIVPVLGMFLLVQAAKRRIPAGHLGIAAVLVAAPLVGWFGYTFFSGGSVTHMAKVVSLGKPISEWITWNALTFYPRTLPHQVGYLVLALAVVGFFMSLRRAVGPAAAIGVNERPIQTATASTALGASPVTSCDQGPHAGARGSEAENLGCYQPLPSKSRGSRLQGRRSVHSLPSDDRCRGTWWLILVWFGVFCGMSIAIQHKEPRYFFFGFLPIALWAGLGAETIIKIVVVNSRGRAVAAGLLVAVPALLGYRMPTPVEPDYGPVIAAHAAQMRGKIVLFEGHRDGDFVFAARERLGWRGCVIIRGSKVFYSCASDPRFDFTSYVSSREDIRAIIHSFGFETLFVERGNAWKLREVEWLQEELNDSGRYLLTRSHELKSTRSDGTERIRTVDVYLPKNPTRRQMRFVNIPVPIAGGSIRIDLAAAVEP